jgi:flagellar motor switch protein FliG
MTKKTLDELREDLEKKIAALRKRGKSDNEIQKEMLDYLLDLRKQGAISIPELDELFSRVQATSEALKKKLEELRSLTG